MKLIFAPASPFARKVTVLLHETGQVDDVELIDVKTSPLATDPMVQAANPLGKIPALIREDGPALYDSRVICRYLDDLAGGGHYPTARQWETLTLEATADGIMDAAVLLTYEKRLRPPAMYSEDWAEAQWDKIASAIAAINSRWMSHLAGRLDISHIAVACALGYVDFRHESRAWRKDNGALDDWYAAFAERPSMMATQPTG